jgi:hypothetical protein
MTADNLNRRTALALIGSAAASTLVESAGASGSIASKDIKPGQPGQFTWEADRAPVGAVVVIVSIPEQRVHVYRGGAEIGVSPCSTGKPGHRTPTGVFTILEKQRKHVSSIYKGAQMPNMERLTWTGIALHAGNLPGYPASHGCIRLPLKFSELLYGVTHSGTVVIVADERTQPYEVAHPGPLLSQTAEAEARSVAGKVVDRSLSGGWSTTIRYPITSVVVSRADGRAYLIRDGRMQGAYPIAFANPARPLGTHAYTLIGPAADNSGLRWLSFGLGKRPTEAHIASMQGDATLRRLVFRDRARALSIASSFHPGSTLLVTDATAAAATRTTPNDFAVIASDPSA